MRRLATLAVLGMLGTALLVSVATPQQNASLGKQGAKDYNEQFTKIGFINSDDSLGKKVTNAQPLPTYDTDRDRDYSVLKEAINLTSLAAWGSYVAGAAIPVGEYSSLTGLLSWNTAAAADSDSVAIAITVIGKISTSASDGFDYLFTPADSATFARADTVLGAAYVSEPPPTCIVISAKRARQSGHAFQVQSVNPRGTTASGGPGVYKPYYISPQLVKISNGLNGVSFTIGDKWGPARFSHVMVKVTNLSNVAYSNVVLRIWPKVN